MKMVMMMMMSTSANSNNHNKIMSEDQDQDQDQDQQSNIINSSTCPISWKLYNNPFFSSTNTSPNHGINPPKLKHFQRKYSANVKYIHHLQSDHKMMSSFANNSDVQARTQVAELKAELEMERKLRKKMEMLNKTLSRELINQADKSKEKMCVYEDLNKEIVRLKNEMTRMKKDMEEERKMLRIAEVLREERVQMKLADAHLFYNHQLLNRILPPTYAALPSNVGNSKRFRVLCEQRQQSNNRNVTGSSSNSSCSSIKNANVQRKASPETGNPHIKQGIKGFVEFQRAIKARNGSNNCSFTSSSVGSNKQSRDLGSYSNKLECQNAQLGVFFKQKYPLPYSHNEHLILS